MPENCAPERPNAKVMAALGRVFAAEIHDRLPLQSRARIYQELCDQGLVRPMTRRVGTMVTVSGFALSEAGRMLYCAHC